MYFILAQDSVVEALRRLRIENYRIAPRKNLGFRSRVDYARASSAKAAKQRSEASRGRPCVQSKVNLVMQLGQNVRPRLLV